MLVHSRPLHRGLTGHILRYIQFFLDLVATSDNIALLYHIALKAKTVRDAESHSYSEVSLRSGYGSLVPVTQDAL